MEKREVNKINNLKHERKPEILLFVFDLVFCVSVFLLCYIFFFECLLLLANAFSLATMTHISVGLELMSRRLQAVLDCSG